jgi:dephospho-CoA kinase
MSLLRLSVIGLAGSGKSTFASIVETIAAERGLAHARVKLAKPLYDLQEQVYATAGVPLRADAQDQLLMEALATALRRIRADSLADHFLTRLASVDADVVVNDDLRDPHVDAVILRRHGFRIVRVTAQPSVRAARLGSRGDLTRSDHSTAELDLIEPEAVIDNSRDIAAFDCAARELIGGWL